MNFTINIPSAVNKNTPQSGPFALKKFITKYQAKKEAKRVIKSLKEVKDFESGKKKPISFDDFLKTL